MKGLTCGIYRGTYNSSNNKLHSKKSVTLVSSPGIPVDGPFEPSEDAPAVVIKTKPNYRAGKGGAPEQGKTYYYAEPAEDPGPGKWYACGGSFISTSDSRFPFGFAVPLHDYIMPDGQSGN